MVNKPLSFVGRYIGETRGAAAAEFALVVTILTIPMINVMDLAMYVYDMMAVQNATQAGAQAAAVTCGTPTKLPALSNCPQLSTVVQAAAQSTWLGTSITSGSIAISEHWYCVSSSSANWTEVTSTTANCGSAGGSSSDRPGDYIQVQITYTYAPIVSAASITTLLGTSISPTTYMRLG